MAVQEARYITIQQPNLTQLKGAFLIFVSAACVSVTYIASKKAFLELSPLAFTPIWFMTASIWGTGFYIARNGLYLPAELSKLTVPVLLLGIINGLATLLFFISINLGSPTLVAFFSRSETVYSVILGVLFMGDRILKHQWLGIVITVVGAGVMTFKSGNVVLLMLIILLISNLLLSISTLIAKKYISKISPLLLSTTRSIILTIMLALIGLVAGELVWPSQTVWLWIIGGSFFGPFLSYVLFYKGLLYLDMSRGTVIRSTQPLFVALYSFIIFSSFISGQQIAGGMLMLAGVVLIIWH